MFQYAKRSRASIVRLAALSAVTAAMAFGSACTRTVVQTSPPVFSGKDAPITGDGAVGAPTSRGAIELFLAAVKTSDLQGMGGYWGTAKGPARDLMKREELEKRLVIMQCLLMHDKYRFVEDSPRLSTGGHQQFIVELTRKSSVAKTTFNTIPGPSGRWFMEDVDLAPLKDFCR